jgi:hypothetical protein
LQALEKNGSGNDKQSIFEKRAIFKHRLVDILSPAKNAGKYQKRREVSKIIQAKKIPTLEGFFVEGSIDRIPQGDYVQREHKNKPEPEDSFDHGL